MVKQNITLSNHKAGLRNTNDTNFKGLKKVLGMLNFSALDTILDCTFHGNSKEPLITNRRHMDKSHLNERSLFNNLQLKKKKKSPSSKYKHFPAGS